MSYLVYMYCGIVPGKCDRCHNNIDLRCVIGSNKNAYDDVYVCLQCVPETSWDTVNMFMETMTLVGHGVYYDFNIDRSRMYVNGGNFPGNRSQCMSIIESFKLTKI